MEEWLEPIGFFLVMVGLLGLLMLVLKSQTSGIDRDEPSFLAWFLCLALTIIGIIALILMDRFRFMA